MTESYRFQVLGPFTVPTSRSRGKREIDFARARDEVFEAAALAVRDRYDITEAIGCYLFGLSPRGGPKTWPYYVGKACEQTLYKRTFQPSDKPRIYNDILDEFDAARPFIYLLPLLTPSGLPARLNSNAKRIRIAEQELIGMALRVNTDLWNIQHRAALESFVIDGITTSGRVSEAAGAMRTMLDRAPRSRVVSNKTTVASAGPMPEV